MSTSAHGATAALSMGPSTGYTSLSEYVQFSIISAMTSMFVMYFFLLLLLVVIYHTCTYMSLQICYDFFGLN
jgi:hypothetical protein